MKSALVRPNVILSVFLFSLLSLLTAVFLLETPSPSQAQSTVTFKNQADVPISGTVRVLCFANRTDTAPFADLNLQVSNGQPSSGTPLPNGCDYLAALHLRHEQPSAKRNDPAYHIYTTSWEPGTTTPQPAEGDLLINDGWPLTLINMVASLAWEPAPSSAVPAASVKQGLVGMAAELYDWTEGRIIFGDITVYTGGERWNEADFRFLPANDKRPSAFVGGIVPTNIAYSDSLIPSAFTPGMAYIGRLWDGEDAFDETAGAWTTPNAYRTLAHEWSHYGLFLFDEYQANSGLSDYCICELLSSSGCGFGERDGSAMAYHYTASEFWHKDTHLTVANFCFDTWHHHVHGESDWNTLTRWHEIQAVDLPFPPLPFPQPELAAGPSLGLAQHLIDRQLGEQRLFLPALRGGGHGTPPSTPLEPLVNLVVDAPLSFGSSLPSQIYLLQGGTDAPSRILPQGRAVGSPSDNVLGQIRLLGADPDDVVRAYVDQPAVGAADAMRYAAQSDAAPTDDILVSADLWDVVVGHHFEIQESRATTLTLALEDGDGRLSNPMVQLCSLDAAIGCHPDWQQPMLEDGTWVATFIPLPEQAELPRYLVARIWNADGSSVANELVFWLQMAGGVGPTHNDGMAPLLDDTVMVNISEPVENLGDCNVVSYMPMNNGRALESPLPAGFGGLLGIPLDLQISFNQDICGFVPLGQEPPLTDSLLLNLGYSQDEATRLGLNEQAQLQILHFDESGWTTVQQIGVNDDLNWITASILEDGIYAVGWLP